jgi:hypothetical protein
MADALSSFVDGFSRRLSVLMDRHSDLLMQVQSDEAASLGADGADAAVAPLLWAAAVGERWDTATVVEFLGFTRQALHKRVVGGSILGLPGRGTTWFPVWQFDLANHRVLPEVADVIAAFRRGLESFDPLVVASWATTEQPELGMAPEGWLAAGKDPAEIVRMARRATAELSQ